MDDKYGTLRKAAEEKCPLGQLRRADAISWANLARPATILALLAERAALAQKAACYDWIREATLSGDGTYIDALREGVPDAVRKGLRDATPAEYDAAIDAAIAAQQKEA